MKAIFGQVSEEWSKGGFILIEFLDFIDYLQTTIILEFGINNQINLFYKYVCLWFDGFSD